MRDNDEPKARSHGRSTRHEVSIFAKHPAPKNLGPQAPIDPTRLKPGLVLWDRFCVIEKPREAQGQLGQLIIAVTDLERDPARMFGDTSEPRLELHQLPAPSSDLQPQWLKGLSINSRVQARVYAYARVGDESVALLCEPTLGSPIAQSSDDGPLSLRGRPLVVLAYQLAGLLAALHRAGVHGVRFDLERLWARDGHYRVDGFSHLRFEEEGGDLESLVGLIRMVGGDSAAPLIEPAPTSALELWRRLRSHDGLEDTGLLPVEPPFVGRDEALLALHRGFDQAQIAKTTILVARGPRGAGKSRLLREFAARRLQANDSLVLTGTWEHDSANTRSGLIGALDLLPRALSRLDEEERADIRMRINYASRGVGAVVARSAPLLQNILRQVEELPPLDLGEDFTRHTAALAGLFRSLGTPKRPLLVVLDNLENADASSVAMLNLLAQPQPAHHTLVVIGFRTDSGRDQPALEAESIDLTPFDAGKVAELLGKTLQGPVEAIESVAETLRSRSKGLPLAIWSSLRTWLDRGHLTHDEKGAWRLQDAARSAEEDAGGRAYFGPILANLTPRVRDFAAHAALLGTKLTDEEVHALCKLSDIAVDEAVEELLHVGVLIQTMGGVRFPHATIREFVLELFEPSERRTGHERIAQMLVERQAPVAHIAYHRELAFDPSTADSAATAQLSRLHFDAGRERLSVYDLERSRWHLERALEHSRDDELRAIMAEGLADVCLLLKDLDGAVSLYTAVIATSDGLRSLQVAGKVTQFLFFQSSWKAGRTLGAMAFEQIKEPTPKSPLGYIALILGSAFRSWLGLRNEQDPKERDAIVRTHLWVAQMCIVDDPLAMLAHVARGMWMGRDLETSPAAMLMSYGAFLWGAVAGRFEHGNELFKKSLEIATTKAKDFWAEAYVRHNWAIHLLASNNYEEGQDMADDAIGAFREAGDVSPTSVTLMFKGLYGRDHEPAEKLLRWFDEAISASRRNGKKLCLVPLECLQLHILARQNPAEIEPLLSNASKAVDCEETAGERLVARTHLIFACYECSETELGKEQIQKGLADIADGPGVPEFCQDFFLAAAFVLMKVPNPSRDDRKRLDSMIKRFRRFAKRSPRLGVYGELLNLKLAAQARDKNRIETIASNIIAAVEIHENFYVAYHAHRALSNSLRGKKVLEAAEHERMALKYASRLGLADYTLTGLSEVQSELAERAFEGTLPDAGQPETPAVWGLNPAMQTSLGDLLEPVRGAVSRSIRADKLELSCSNPSVKVPLESSTLQVLIITMLLACRDLFEVDAAFNIELVDGWIEPGSSVGQLEDIPQGRYLTVRVAGRGDIVHNSMISGYPTCEQLVSDLNGRLTASIDKSGATLTALISLNEDMAEPVEGAQLSSGVIVHPDPSVREAIGLALDEVGVPWRAYEPDEFGPATVEHAKVILAHSEALDDLVVLGPLLNAQLVEIIEEGEEPNYYDHESLHMPPTPARLKELFQDT